MVKGNQKIYSHTKYMTTSTLDWISGKNGFWKHPDFVSCWQYTKNVGQCTMNDLAAVHFTFPEIQTIILQIYSLSLLSFQQHFLSLHMCHACFDSFFTMLLWFISVCILKYFLFDFSPCVEFATITGKYINTSTISFSIHHFLSILSYPYHDTILSFGAYSSDSHYMSGVEHALYFSFLATIQCYKYLWMSISNAMLWFTDNPSILQGNNSLLHTIIPLACLLVVWNCTQKYLALQHWILFVIWRCSVSLQVLVVCNEQKIHKTFLKILSCLQWSRSSKFGSIEKSSFIQSSKRYFTWIQTM